MDPLQARLKSDPPVPNADYEYVLGEELSYRDLPAVQDVGIPMEVQDFVEVVVFDCT